MVTVSVKGDWKATEKWLARIPLIGWRAVLSKYAEDGVRALREATPIDSGMTRDCWTYELVQNGSGFAIKWNNTNVNKGVQIALLLQYGHGTGTGGYVEGRDYINPALRPYFDQMAEIAWREVMK